MYYLYAYNRGLIRIILQILWKQFLIPSLYIFEKTILVNKYKKQTYYKKYKSILDVMKNGPNLSFQSLSFSIWWQAFFSSEMGNIRTCKNLQNLDCQDSNYLVFFKLLKNEQSFGKSFSFPSSPKCFDRNFKCLF